MTIQTLLNRMLLYDNQLDVVSGGDDVARGILALNIAQDWWEATAATYADFLATASTFTTTANTESTTWPSTLKRVDSLWRLGDTSLPVAQITPIQDSGGHAIGGNGPFTVLGLSPNPGAPAEYWATGPGGLFYWAPMPDAVYTLRAYGLWEKGDYSTAAETFLYPKAVATVLPPVAVRILKVGLDRDLSNLQEHSKEMFKPAVLSLRGFVREEPTSKVYADYHCE